MHWPVREYVERQKGKEYNSGFEHQLIAIVSSYPNEGADKENDCDQNAQTLVESPVTAVEDKTYEPYV